MSKMNEIQRFVRPADIPTLDQLVAGIEAGLREIDLFQRRGGRVYWRTGQLLTAAQAWIESEGRRWKRFNRERGWTADRPRKRISEAVLIYRHYSEEEAERLGIHACLKSIADASRAKKERAAKRAKTQRTDVKTDKPSTKTPGPARINR
jgi:hypothetical protein